MRGLLRAWLLIGACLLGTEVAWTQQVATGPMIQVQQGAQRTMATVTGHVTCSDTQQPARFAEVMLVSVEEALGSSGRRGFGQRASGRTDLDGNFTMEAEPGDYYAVASATGYASTVAEAEARLSAGATTADLLRQLPQVHVAENGGGPVNLTIDRGGVISGKLQWDDGSPAAGVNVVAMSTTQSAQGEGELSDVLRLSMQLGGGLGRGEFAMSDDRGVFRLMGLSPGSYWVRATVMTPLAEPAAAGFGLRLSNVTMYAPGKVRRGEAQTITLKSGEERDDVVFVMDLRALHTVSGHVSATGGGTVASGEVRLTDSQDSTLVREGSVGPDGSFVVQWVPAGTYTLGVTNAGSTARRVYFGGRGQRGGGGDSGTRFQSFQESLTVSDTDVSGVLVSLTPATASQ